MKMKLYYVVKDIHGGFNKEHQDVEYIAGPFDLDSALENKNIKDNPWQFSIVEQVIDVQY